MKHLTLILATLLFVSCGGSSKKTQQETTSEICVPEYIELDCNDDGIVDRADLKEYVVGDFNGDGNEEYAALYYYKQLLHDDFEEWDYYKYDHNYMIAFGDKALPMKDVEWSGRNLVNEGDLNGDGADEIGLFYWGGYSACGTYAVHTYNGNEWRDLIFISHNENWNPAPYQELVRKDPNNEHHLIVKEIRLDDGYILDKVVAIDGMNVTFRFDKTIGGYDVVMHWQPFEPKGCETGTAIVDFEDLGLRFQYVNNEKFSSYFIDEIVFDESFEGFKDGDEYTLAGDVTKASPYPNSPLDYYMPFQFYDVDFDGKDELLVNDWGRGQGGNCYTAYDIADKEIIEKLGAPFNAIDNTTVFDPSYETITIYGQDGVWYSYELTYIRVSKADVHEIDIPTSFDENLKSCLEKFASDIPSEFKIIGAQIDLGDHHYDLSVKNNSWYINRQALLRL